MTEILEEIQTVSKIAHGTVIDHINTGKALRIVRLLKLDKTDQRVSIGLHLPSAAMGTKDLIKVEGKILSTQETSQIAILAPNAVINLIQDYKVIKKYPVEIPQEVEGFIICPNKECITHVEPLQQKYEVEGQCGKALLRCCYCEYPFLQDHIKEFKL